MLNPRKDPMPSVGIGFRVEHYHDLIQLKPNLSFLEVHSENYFSAGKSLSYLKQLARYYALSFHGVGLSLGSMDPLDTQHLFQLKCLIDSFQPRFVSEHIAWSSIDGRHLHDLLPLPYTEEFLQHFIERVLAVQDYLGRSILVENISSYLQYHASEISEPDFLTYIAQQTHCGLLLDVNNVYVNAKNHGFDPHAYLDAIPTQHVQEIHLAGFTLKRFEEGEIRIDTHNQYIVTEVWQLYEYAIARFGKVPTLIEWDTDLPPLDMLLSEADKAARILSTAEKKERKTAEVISRKKIQRSITKDRVVTLQRQFAETIFDSEKEECLSSIKENGLPATRRLQVYRNNIFSTLTNTLKATYPTIQRLVGDAFFHHLASVYSHEFPSYAGNLQAYGEQFAEFVQGFPATQSLVYLPEMAQLEWGYHQALHAADQPCFDHSLLQNVPLSQYPDLRFQLHPSCQLFDFQYPILAIWQFCQTEANSHQPLQLSKTGIKLMVTRCQDEVLLEPLDAGEYTFLKCLLNRDTFGLACEQAVAANPLIDIPSLFKKYIAQGAIVGFTQ